MSGLLIINDEFPVESKHINFRVKKSKDGWGLSEILENRYRHPEALDIALIPKLEELDILSVKDNDPRAHSLILLYYAQKTVEQLFISKMIGSNS